LRITSEQEKELIERELVKEKKSNQEAMGILQDILVSIGVFLFYFCSMYSLKLTY
jgi:hypothetical protein